MVVIERMGLAPRVGVDHHLVAVLVEPIDEGGDAGGTGEHGAPLLEREVGGELCIIGSSMAVRLASSARTSSPWPDSR